MSIKAMNLAVDFFEGWKVKGIDDPQKAAVAVAEILRKAIKQAEQDEAALIVKTWNAAIEAAAHKFELFDTWYYDEVQESILRLKK